MPPYTNPTKRVSETTKLPQALLKSLSCGARASLWQKLIRPGANYLPLDRMSDTALEELGIMRVGRGVRWLDYREAFARGDFEYHFIRR